MEDALQIIQGLGLLALFSLGVLIVQRSKLSLQSPNYRKILSGLLFGVLTAVVMLDPIKLQEGATIDVRAGPAILAGVFAGPVGAAITATIGSLVRWYVVGGPFAFGGVIGFLLYGVFGVAAGLLLKRWGISLRSSVFMALGLLGTIAITPAFFVSADFTTGVAILKKVGVVLTLNNVIGTLIVGLVFHHISQWVNLRNKLDEQQGKLFRLSRIADETSNGVVITGRDGKIEWMNAGFERISGYSLEESIGRVPGSFLQRGDVDPNVVAHMRECVAQLKPFNVVVRNYKKSGTSYWIDINCQPFKDHGGIDRFMAIETDVTEQVETRNELHKALMKAEEADKAKSYFLAGMSHEIRTPLNAIIGFSEMLDIGIGADDPATRSENLKIIASAGKRLDRLLADILDYSKIEADTVELYLENVLPSEVFQEQLPIVQHLLVEKNITFADIQKSDKQIYVDRDRLSQILINFISNAIKYNHEGGSVEFGCRELPDDMLTIYVKDTGIGIAPGSEDVVFEPFSRMRATKREVAGVGIGLSICKKLTEQMGGEIGYESGVGEGSTFWVKFPISFSK